MECLQCLSLSACSIIDDIVEAVPSSLPPIDTVSHLHPLKLRPQLNFFISGKKYVGEATDSPKVLFANRARLRAWLATDLDIRFGKKAVRICEIDEAVTVHFSDGSSATGDMLVGADGSGSFGRCSISQTDSVLTSLGPVAYLPWQHKSTNSATGSCRR